MAKVCVECGFSAPSVEMPLPGSPTVTSNAVEEPNRCPSCGKTGVMEEVADMPSGEDEEE